MNYVIRFGYHSGDIYVTVAGQAVDNDDLTAALYHIYAAGSPISYTAEHLPANAVFQHHEHSVYTYTYFCDTCGQWEVATVGERCSCCKLAERKGERWHMF